MDNCTIRQYSLSGYNKQIRSLLISNQGLKVYKWIINKRQATSGQVAIEFDLSPQHSSTMLNKLFKQCYLRRHEQPQDSGGYEWVYYP